MINEVGDWKQAISAALDVQIDSLSVSEGEKGILTVTFKTKPRSQQEESEVIPSVASKNMVKVVVAMPEKNDNRKG